MKCLECQGYILVKRSIHNLFNPVHQVICNECLAKNTKTIKRVVIPIERYKMYWYTICLEEPKVDFSYDILFEPIIKDFLKHKKTDIILFSDTLDTEIYELLDQLLIGNIWLLTTYNKGEDYYEV